ncbi:uncharacterized protein LOC128678392 isoform X2 [Plodia interpunctella]|uniref:uncharacterized protein LOC128678392 isoform X2 n=1 Tax=Plodia interpunctella TaxID=58824 RepID=UPI0031014610
MSLGIILKFNVVVIFIVGAICLDIIPESVKITYVNNKFVDEVYANIRRYSRSGSYYINLWGSIKHTWANNISVHIVTTEFLHNEYRRSFIEFHYKFCDFINKEPMIGQMFVLKGVVCPLPKGEYRLMNMTVQSQHFPNRWPFEKGGADVNVTTTYTKEVVASGYIHLKFKQDKKKN